MLSPRSVAGNGPGLRRESWPLGPEPAVQEEQEEGDDRWTQFMGGWSPGHHLSWPWLRGRTDGKILLSSGSYLVIRNCHTPSYPEKGCVTEPCPSRIREGSIPRCWTEGRSRRCRGPGAGGASSRGLAGVGGWEGRRLYIGRQEHRYMLNITNITDRLEVKNTKRFN